MQRYSLELLKDCQTIHPSILRNPNPNPNPNSRQVIGEKIGFYFAVQSGGNFDIDYDVTDPNIKVNIFNIFDLHLISSHSLSDVCRFCFLARLNVKVIMYSLQMRLVNTGSALAIQCLLMLKSRSLIPRLSGWRKKALEGISPSIYITNLHDHTFNNRFLL